MSRLFKQTGVLLLASVLVLSSCRNAMEDEILTQTEEISTNGNNIITFGAKDKQTFDVSDLKAPTKLNFQELSTGNKVDFQTENKNIPYYFERVEEGIKLMVNPLLLTQSLEIYDGDGNLYKTIKPQKLTSNLSTMSFSNGDVREQGWGWVVGVIVYCCVKAEINDKGWSVKFDCQCIK